MHGPFGTWRTLTFLAAIRYGRIDARCLLDSPINGERFTGYLTQFLLTTRAPDDVVIMDNLFAIFVSVITLPRARSGFCGYDAKRNH